MHNLHPGCKFAPRVHFWLCERCFKNLHPGANFANLHRVQMCSYFLGAICAYERKMINFYTF